MTLTCIIPTVGRPSLYKALESCRTADEVIVVVDDGRAGAWQPERLAANVKVIHVPTCARGGHQGRNAAMPHATGTHLCFLDDDDIYTYDAIDLFRAHAADVPVIFRMDHYKHGILWREPLLEFGNVSTQMFVVPNDPAKLARWEEHMPGIPEPGGDYTFLKGCAETMGDPVWREELVAVLRPDMPTVSIVTPWWNHLELMADYIAAVAHRSPRDELIVVDNASKPPVGLPGIRLTTNQGFAAASNRGLEAATRDIVLFLNNDIAMTRTDWLEPLRGAVEPGVLAGAQIRYDQHGHVDGQPLPYLDGWCLAGTRDDLLDLEGFDESYAEPAYYSDNDLCLRARAAGMTLREARVGLRHKLNQTAGPDTSPVKQAASRANRERFTRLATELLAPHPA